MSEQAAARFDALYDAIDNPLPRVWDCTPRESYVYQYDSYEGLDERERPAMLHILSYRITPLNERQQNADLDWSDYLHGYSGPESRLVREQIDPDDDRAFYAWPDVQPGSPEHNARREAFGLEPVDSETRRFGLKEGNVGRFDADSIRDFYLGAAEAVRGAVRERQGEPYPPYPHVRMSRQSSTDGTMTILMGTFPTGYLPRQG